MSTLNSTLREVICATIDFTNFIDFKISTSTLQNIQCWHTSSNQTSCRRTRSKKFTSKLHELTTLKEFALKFFIWHTMLKKLRNFIDCSSTHIVDFVDLASSQRHSFDWIAHNVEKAHIALSSLHESTTLKEFTIKLLHDIQYWKVSKLYWLIVDSHRWLQTFHACNNHSWLSWETLLAHEKQKRATTIVLSCFKELFIATSI